MRLSLDAALTRRIGASTQSSAGIGAQVAHGMCGDLGSPRRRQLAQDVGDVVLYRARAQEKSRCDLVVGEAQANQPCDIFLTPAQGRVRRRSPRGAYSPAPPGASSPVG